MVSVSTLCFADYRTLPGSIGREYFQKFKTNWQW